MAKTFLCLDFGAFTVKAAEFEPNEMGSLRLVNYGLRTLGPEGFKEERDELVLSTVKELIAEAEFKATEINVCAPGFQVFSKFVKLPSVDASKVNQIIQFEAQQNVPFPLDEVVWDYQILGTTPNDELEVLLVAIRNEVVESIFGIGEGAGLELHLVDVSSAALANSYRFNYGDAEGCVMLLDIGAKSSNLLFFEQGRVFSRGINIGANSITQDFAAESKLDWDEAERLKIEEGFVSLGGAYEEPDNPNQALISKIARQVMTRLHIQMNQTIQFYRGQQGGSPPEKLYLAGGASLLPYTAQFFAEKLNVPVDYFNPFRNIQIDEEINLEEIAKVAHTFGEVVGLGIRNLAQCPVDLNLMPVSHIRRQQLNSKRIYFFAAVVCIALAVVSFGFYAEWVGGQASKLTAELKTKFEPLDRDSKKLQGVQGQYASTESEANQYVQLFATKTRWAQLMRQIQLTLLGMQTNHGVKVDPSIMSTNPVIARVWIEKLTATAAPSVEGFGFGRDEEGGMDEDMEQEQSLASMIGVLQGDMGATIEVPPPGSEKVGFLNLTCKALNLMRFSPSANTEFGFSLQKAFQTNDLFMDSETGLVGSMEMVTPTNSTYRFNIILRLQEDLVVN
ncbi:MAG: type IV pilus assembly protein PilM [Verrucomicrobiae bacterium]|jgi:type IV pilus assembly protein PilM|nr:type IV pilus assembly protein PilM [Verrucomicrobiae bacterium]